MRLQKRLSALALAICLLLAMCVTAYAHEAVDMDRAGSISVTMRDDGVAVPGGTLTLYQVGEVAADDGNYSFALTGDFAESGVSLDDISSSDLAGALAAYVTANGLTGTEIAIGTDGTATVSDLALGLYLVVQTEAAEGYAAVSPFLVSVPMNEGGAYVYEVDATPKLGILTEAPETPDTPETPAEPTTPVTPTEPTLPQTGQLNWPVPVLVVSGLCLLLLGWALRYGKKERLNAA